MCSVFIGSLFVSALRQRDTVRASVREEVQGRREASEILNRRGKNRAPAVWFRRSTFVCIWLFMRSKKFKKKFKKKSMKKSLHWPQLTQKICKQDTKYTVTAVITGKIPSYSLYHLDFRDLRSAIVSLNFNVISDSCFTLQYSIRNNISFLSDLSFYPGWVFWVMSNSNGSQVRGALLPVSH